MMKQTKKWVALFLAVAMICCLTGCETDTTPKRTTAKVTPFDLTTVVLPETNGQYHMRYTMPVADTGELTKLFCGDQEHSGNDGIALGDSFFTYQSEVLVHYFHLCHFLDTRPGLDFLKQLVDRPNNDPAYDFARSDSQAKMDALGYEGVRLVYEGKFSADDQQRMWSEYSLQMFNSVTDASSITFPEEMYYMVYEFTPTALPEALHHSADTQCIFAYTADGLAGAYLRMLPSLKAEKETALKYTLEEAYQRALDWCERKDATLIDAYYTLHSTDSPQTTKDPLYSGYWFFHFVAPTMLEDLNNSLEADILTSLGLHGRYKVCVIKVDANTGTVRLGAWRYYGDIVESK